MVAQFRRLLYVLQTQSINALIKSVEGRNNIKCKGKCSCTFYIFMCRAQNVDPYTTSYPCAPFSPRSTFFQQHTIYHIPGFDAWSLCSTISISNHLFSVHNILQLLFYIEVKQLCFTTFQSYNYHLYNSLVFCGIHFFVFTRFYNIYFVADKLFQWLDALYSPLVHMQHNGSFLIIIFECLVILFIGLTNICF